MKVSKLWLWILIIVVVVNLALVYFLIISRDKSNLPKIDLKDAVISIQNLDPVKEGDPFIEPVIQGDGSYALYIVNGRLQAMTSDKNYHYLAVINHRGKPIYEVVPVSKYLKAQLNDSSSNQNNKLNEIDIDLTEIKPSDNLVISYNIDLKTKQLNITNIQVSRF